MPRRADLPLGRGAGAAAGVALTDTRTGGGDVSFFLGAGSTLLSGDWAQTYADPAVQSGPLQLAFFGLGAWIPWGVLVLAQVGGTVLLLVGLMRVLGPRPAPGRWIVLGFGWSVVVLGLPLTALTGGHPAHLIVPALCLAGAEARRHRPSPPARSSARGGLGDVGSPRRRRPRARAARVKLSQAPARPLRLPEPSSSPSSSPASSRWANTSGASGSTLPGLVLDPGSAFPWGLRVQAAAAVGAGAAVAWRLRGTPHAVTASLATVAFIRLAFDPVFYSWYWVRPALVLAAAADVVSSPWFVGVLRDGQAGRGLPMGSPGNAALAAMVFAPALALGSFLNVVVARLPEHRSLVRPRSACPRCGHELAWWENVPPSRTPRCAAAARAARLRSAGATRRSSLRPRRSWPRASGTFGLTGDALVAAYFCAVLVALSAIDVERRILPNAIVLPSFVLVLSAQPAHPRPALEWVLGALGASLFLFAALLAYPKGMGMGDVKLALLLGAMLGKLVGVGLMLGTPAALGLSVVLFAQHGAAARKMAIPFGPFLAFGSIVALFWGPRSRTGTCRLFQIRSIPDLRDSAARADT